MDAPCTPPLSLFALDFDGGEVAALVCSWLKLVVRLHHALRRCEVAALVRGWGRLEAQSLPHIYMYFPQSFVARTEAKSRYHACSAGQCETLKRTPY